MLKIGVGFISFFFVSVAEAAVPNVQCDMMYRRFTEGEAETYSSSVLKVTEEGGSIEDNGFILSGHLRQNCAADGGPCAGSYGLTVTITKGTAESYLNANAAPVGFERYSAGMKVENESVFVNCSKFPNQMKVSEETASKPESVDVVELVENPVPKSENLPENTSETLKIMAASAAHSEIKAEPKAKVQPTVVK